MGVDFHWIGTTISSGSSHNGFGKIVSFPSVPAGFPAAGTILSTIENVTFLYGDGGEYQQWQDPFELGYYNVSTQFADVYVKADGSGGSYTDWANAFNEEYYPFGTILYYGTWATNSYQINTNCNGTQYITDGGIRGVACAEGNGGIYNGANQYQNLMSFGTQVYSESCDDGSGNYIDTYYYSDGNGYYYT